MIRRRSFVPLIAGILLIASWNYSTGRNHILGIKGVDWSKYPDVEVHAIFPITFFGGVVLLALGIVFIKSDIEASQRNKQNG